MVRASANSVNPHVHSGVRIVVAGDKGTGKSSLISTAASENFRPNVAPVLPPTTLAVDLYPDHVPITVIDTTSSYEFSTFSSKNSFINRRTIRLGYSTGLYSLSNL